MRTAKRDVGLLLGLFGLRERFRVCTSEILIGIKALRCGGSLWVATAQTTTRPARRAAIGA